MKYKVSTYKEVDYIVCEYNNEHKKQYFIIDEEDLDKIKNISWTIIGKKIGNSKYFGKNVYLHNFIMDCETNNYEHINQNYYDNRKCNLKYVTDEEKIYNRKRRIRYELPEDSGIDVNELPMNVWFNSDENRFMVKIYHEKDVYWHSSSSKKHSLRFKLEQTKDYLRYLHTNYPELYNDDKCSNISKSLIKSLKKFNKILINSGFSSYKNSIVKIPEYIDYLHKYKLSDGEMNELKNLEKYYTIDKLSKKSVPLSDDKYILPKHVIYQKPDKNGGGECFIVQNHPIISEKSGKKKLKTKTSKNISLDDKYQEIKDIFKKYDCPFKI